MLFKRKKQVEISKPITESAHNRNTSRRNLESDRRSFGLPTNFPFIDTEKKIVQQDRRSRPERRINNIVVEETNIKLDAEFLKF